MKKSNIKKYKLKVDRDDTLVTLPSIRDPHNIYEGQSFDIMLHAWVGKITGWLSPASLHLAWHDWWSHLAISPAKQLLLMQKLLDLTTQLSIAAFNFFGTSGLEMFCGCRSQKQDGRFNHEDWQQFPFSFYTQFFLLCENWWDTATKDIRGISAHHENIVNFMTRQFLDMLSPSNHPLTNPEIINATIATHGQNLIAGFNNFIEDFCRMKNDLPPAGTERFTIGKDVAVTPGKVVYRNQLIELIQYQPQTRRVFAEPILIVPAWIMKYYILDLSPHNSLVKYLVGQGHTVFIISWKNPDSKDRDLGTEDYLNFGIVKSLDIISQIIPNQKVHAVGYCLGGTLLSIAAAALASRQDTTLKSMTLFASELDFKDSGELSLFIDQSQVTYMEDVMWEKGYLDGQQMAWAFSMLRSNDLIWSRMIHDYWFGERRPINDLIAWDYDTTHIPFRLHSECLRNLFLNNELVQGHYKIDNKRVALTDINVPIFVASTLKDHISPWHSVYKIHLFTNTDITFVLTTGGHNAGIVSEPGHKNRYFQILLHEKDKAYLSPDRWLQEAPTYEGSWWVSWHEWLRNHSGEKISATRIYHNDKYYICDAPGTYVLMK